MIWLQKIILCNQDLPCGKIEQRIENVILKNSRKYSRLASSIAKNRKIEQ